MSQETPESQQSPESIDLEQLHAFVRALISGDFSARLHIEGSPRAVDIAGGINGFMERMSAMTSEVKRICDEIASGKFGGQAEISLPPGPWRQCVEAVNVMSWALTDQIRDMSHSVKLMADGKASRKVTARCEGETLELKNALNAAIDRARTHT
jgi:methyl-accepting chemotaxis protein